MYCVLRFDRTEKGPGKLVHIVPVVVSARAAAHITLFSCAAHTCSGGFISARSRRASLMTCVWLLVDQIPLQFLCMCPFAVVVEGADASVMLVLTRGMNPVGGCGWHCEVLLPGGEKGLMVELCCLGLVA